MKPYFTAGMVLLCSGALAQDSTKQNSLAISAYAESYYSYDFNKPVNNSKPSFFYSYNRNNEVNLDLGFIRAAYNNNKIRAALSLAAGTYINANYAEEPGVLKNVYEANMGIRLSGKSELWLDAGIFSSHIGFESAAGKDCWNLSRSILAENSPYFESGARVSYHSKNTKWFLSGLVLNGWQRITRPAGNTTPAFGTQVTFTPSGKITLNSSTFAGNNKPDTARRMRYFHNFYGIFQINKQFAFTLGFDYGMEQQEKGSSTMNQWYAPVVLFRYTPDDKNSIAARIEYYSDEKGVIIASGTPHGFKTVGWSVNYDRQLFSNALWRIELRGLEGKDAYFADGKNGLSAGALMVTTALAVSF
jgi:hypothetical protein